MMETGFVCLPNWLDWVHAIGPTVVSIVTAVVAGAVGIIAYRQWRTAREKLVLDLFERRFALYERARDSLTVVVQSGRADGPDGLEAIRSIARARIEADFLFGDEVEAFLAGTQRALASIALAHTKMQTGDTTQDWPQVNHDAMLKVINFHEDFRAVAAPYMRMKQRL